MIFFFKEKIDSFISHLIFPMYITF